ncbi:TCR/Tet family MFS transporter [Seohaeicola saemankumensis]|uniref:TCR/Tet family MFS transporter n=1 Tax=Seohaeicola saemankumensis TaxID=481181 RepID=UPI001E60BA19|nr:TCR/Tet family MFS transporter [Seohaeicola saemankumensis]MCD1626035.1 TCR/Tet family MFS transporter [Seohaeicola saemankumensis]
MRLPVLFILITVVIDAIGIGLILPVMPGLIRETTGGSLAQAAVWGGVLSTAFALMQFLFGPFLGALSDRFGRRPVLLISLLVMAADYVVMALAGSIWLLLAGRIVGGITAATHSTASAYMADISEPHEKARNFGLIGAAFGIGFVLGPVIGGLLAEWGTRAPFIAAALLALANAGFGWFVLRETVTDRIRRKFEARRANPFGAIRSVSRLAGVGPLIWVYFLYHFATVVYPAIWAYFTAERFDWSPGLIGVSLAIYGISLAVVQGTLVGPATRILGDAGAVMLGLLIEVVALVILGFISSGVLLLLLIPVTALGAIGLPALQGILSRAVADNAQGELQGVLASLTAIAMVLAPLLMTQTFSAFSRADAAIYLPGAPFLLSAVIMALATALYLLRGRRLAG